MNFSLIVPVYNVEKYLRGCLDSVLHQSFTAWEVICVNDGATDGSAQIIEQYAAEDSRISVITEANAGLSAARNTGMDAACGEYILFLDSDDWLEPDALEILAQNISGEDMLCFSGRRYIERENKYHLADQLQERTFSTGMDYYNENALLPRDFAFVCVVLRAYRRAFLADNKLRFKPSIFHEDNLFTPISCYFAGTVKVINRCLYNYRVRTGSITTKFNSKRISDFLDIANMLAAFFVPLNGFDKTTVYRAITHHYQVVFLHAPKESKRDLRKKCDWALYHMVSRTKVRHRINYLINKYL